MRPWWLLGMVAGCFVPDPVVDRYVDWDDDGEQTVAFGGTDCDDDDPDVNQQADELCDDGIDNNCDGYVDDVGTTVRWFLDGDGDGFGGEDKGSASCAAPAGHVADGSDCNDEEVLDHPLAEERCGDDVDNDCDGLVDDRGVLVAWFVDQDGDGAGAPGDPLPACARPADRVRSDDDCDDNNDAVYPDAHDVFYDAVDSNCDGVNDFDFDGDGYVIATDHDDVVGPHPGVGPLGADCDDRNALVNPSSQENWYDGVDGNCDGADDFDQDGDGYQSDLFGGSDCDDADGQTHPGAFDTPYDGIDHNCDLDDFDVDADGVNGGPNGLDCNDEDPNNHTSCLSCVDVDGDGAFSGCDRYETIDEDCDDLSEERHPGAFEIIGDGIDQDCSGSDLDLAHPALVFVASSGADGPTCGNIAAPCATIQHGVNLAAATGRGVVVAQGQYAGFSSEVPVYGGLLEDFSAQSPNRTTIVQRPTGSRAVVTLSGGGMSGVDIALEAAPTGTVVGVSVQAEATLHDVSVSIAGQATQCAGVELRASTILGEVEVVRCTGVDSSVAVESTPSAVGVVRVFDSHIRLTESSAYSVGIRSNFDALFVSNTEIEVVGPSVRGIEGRNSLSISDSNIRVDSARLAFGIEQHAGVSVMVERTRLTSECGGCRAIAVTPAGAMDLTVVDSVLSFAGVGFDLQFGGEISTVVGHTVMVGPGGNAFAASGSHRMDVVNSVVDAATFLEGDATYGLHGAAVQLGCVVSMGSCLHGLADPGGHCPAPFCVEATAVQVTPLSFVDGDPALGVDPQSSAVDAGVDPSPWLSTTTDAIGGLRPRGAGWDLGPVEQR